jgi:hypothetical protein
LTPPAANTPLESMTSRRWRLLALAVVAMAAAAAMWLWHARSGPEGHYRRLVHSTTATYGFGAGDLELLEEYKRSIDRAPRGQERSLNAFRLQKAVFDYLLITLDGGPVDALQTLESSYDVPARGAEDVRARVRAVVLAAEPSFEAIAHQTAHEETRRFIEIGIGMYRELARWLDPADHRLHEPILRQASCTDTSWAGGSRYLLAQAIRGSLLDAPPGDAAATQALLELRLGPVLGFSCPARTEPLKAAVDLPRSTAADLARSGIPASEGAPPAALLALDLLAFTRDWTGRGLSDHPLRDVFAAFEGRLAEDLGALRLALPDGRSARLAGKGVRVE